MIIEAILVVCYITIAIFIFSYFYEKPLYKEGDYVVWLGALYKVTKVEGNFLIVEDTLPLKENYLIETNQPRLKKVSKEFAEKYLSLKDNKARL